MTNWIWCNFLNKGMGRQNIGGGGIGHSIKGGWTSQSRGADTPYKGDGHSTQGRRTIHTRGMDTTNRGDGHYTQGGGTLHK